MAAAENFYFEVLALRELTLLRALLG